MTLPPFPLLQPTDSLLVYGDSGEGKTCQVGELAKYIMQTTGLSTRLYTADKGHAWGSIQHLINVAVIEVIQLEGDPWRWFHRACSNLPAPPRPVGLLAFEGLTSIGETLLLDVAQKAAEGRHSGGEKRFSLMTEAGIVSGLNQSDYGLVQLRIQEEVWRSQRHGIPVIWTAAVRRGQDELQSVVIGPEVVGKAMTAAAPRWFKYCFRLERIDQPSGAARHVLHLGGYKDLNAGLSKALGNARIPLDGSETVVPNSIEPASLVQALTVLKARERAAEAAVKKELCP